MFAYAFDSSLIFELKDLGVAAHNFTDLLYSGRFGPTQKNILSKLGKAPKISMNKRKNLIIGKNSSIVRSILHLLPDNFELISHSDIKETNFDKFEEIFLFSWSNSTSKMHEILAFVPVKKLVFISVLGRLCKSLIFFQISSYPRKS